MFLGSHSDESCGCERLGMRVNACYHSRNSMRKVVRSGKRTRSGHGNSQKRHKQSCSYVVPIVCTRAMLVRNKTPHKGSFPAHKQSKGIS